MRKILLISALVLFGFKAAADDGLSSDKYISLHTKAARIAKWQRHTSGKICRMLQLSKSILTNRAGCSFSENACKNLSSAERSAHRCFVWAMIT